jgi:hypothetical protein
MDTVRLGSGEGSLVQGHCTGQLSLCNALSRDTKGKVQRMMQGTLWSRSFVKCAHDRVLFQHRHGAAIIEHIGGGGKAAVGAAVSRHQVATLQHAVPPSTSPARLRCH